MTTAIAAFLKPFALVLILLFLYGVRTFIMRALPDGWLKRLLLRRV
jgi:hypothetical protein